MLLRDYLSSVTKAQLQSCYVYWFPGKEILSVRERLVTELQAAMTDQTRVRLRFDSLSKAQQGFIISLLVREGFSGTVEQVRAHKYGHIIEDFEVEGTLKVLQEACYIVRTSGTGGYAKEVFTMPLELGEALLRTVSVEERMPLDLLSLRVHKSGLNGNGSGSEADISALVLPESVRARLDALVDSELRSLTAASLSEHDGVLVHSLLSSSKSGECGPQIPSSQRFSRPDWRYELEKQDLGTTGILSLKDFGIDLEEEGLFIFQELVYETSLAEAHSSVECEREISVGADLIVDLERLLEVLRSEALEVTREGNVYKRIEERIAGQFVTAQYIELHDGSPVGHVLELGRKLQLFDEENQKAVVDPLRRWAWRKRPLIDKVSQIFEIYVRDRKGHRWSFHQTAIREIFLGLLKSVSPGRWLVARPFLSAAVSKFLLSLEELEVRKAYHERCTGNFKNETLVVSLSKLHYDLSYWVLHRLGLLGIIDIGYCSGVFHALRLSRLGQRLFGFVQPSSGDRCDGSQMMVNPDFEILIYPEAPEELNWKTSLFADRIGSDRVKRYRLTRESLKRGAVAGLSQGEVVLFLETNSRGIIPPNVLFSLREWTEGVELVRLQKVRLLRSQTVKGAEKLSALLEAKSIPFERLNETTVMVRGGKNERAVLELQEYFRDHGLFVE